MFICILYKMHVTFYSAESCSIQYLKFNFLKMLFKSPAYGLLNNENHVAFNLVFSICLESHRKGT